MVVLHHDEARCARFTSLITIDFCELCLTQELNVVYVIVTLMSDPFECRYRIHAGFKLVHRYSCSCAQNGSRQNNEWTVKEVLSIPLTISDSALACTPGEVIQGDSHDFKISLGTNVCGRKIFVVWKYFTPLSPTARQIQATYSRIFAMSFANNSTIMNSLWYACTVTYWNNAFRSHNFLRNRTLIASRIVWGHGTLSVDFVRF